MTVRVKVDTRDAIALLKKVERQLPYAKARALTAVARLAVDDLKTDMKTVFQSPSGFTLNAFYAKPATRNDPTAFVASREFATKGRPAIKYLWPQIAGGRRPMKGFERLLANQSADQFVIPGVDSLLGRGQITQVLSRLSALRDPNQNLTSKTTRRLQRKKMTVAAAKHRSEYFIAREGGKPNGRPIGIYKLIGPGNVQRVMGFVPNAPRYVPRFNPEKVIREGIGRYLPGEFRKALADALATAK